MATSGNMDIPEVIVGQIVWDARQICSSPTAQLIKDMQEVRDFIFRSDYYDNYLDKYNPSEYAENPVCGMRFDLDMDALENLDMRQFGADWMLGACGICPNCMADKFKEQADLEDVRAEKHQWHPKPSENKENNMWLKSVRGHRTLASELLNIRILADDFSRAN